MCKLKFLLFFSFFFTSQAFSECDCLPIPNPIDAKNNSTNVFIADVVKQERIRIPDIVPNYQELRTKVRVSKIWKGKVKRFITIRVPETTDECGLKLEVGKSYLFYTLGGTVPLVNRCTRTVEITTKQANNDILKLGDDFIYGGDL